MHSLDALMKDFSDEQKKCIDIIKKSNKKTDDNFLSLVVLVANNNKKFMNNLDNAIENYKNERNAIKNGSINIDKFIGTHHCDFKWFMRYLGMKHNHDMGNFAENLGVSVVTISSYMNEKEKPTEQFIEDLIRVYQLSDIEKDTLNKILEEW